MKNQEDLLLQGQGKSLERSMFESDETQNVNMSCEMAISKNSISHIINEDLRATAYKRRTKHLLTKGLIEKKAVKCNRLLQECVGRNH